VHTELLTPTWHLVLLLFDLLVAAAVLVLPLTRRYPDDRGDGMALVLLPRPHPVKAVRTAALLGVFVVLAWLQTALVGTWSLDHFYDRAVTALTTTVIHAPAEVAGFTSGAAVGARFLVVATLISLALTVQAPLARRLLILSNVVWFLLLMVCVDAVITVSAALFGYLGPLTGLVGGFIALVLGMVTLLRAVVANFALPKPSEVPLSPSAKSRAHTDSWILLLVTVASVAVSAAICFALVAKFPAVRRPELLLFLPLPFAGAAVLLRTGLLHVMRWLRPNDPLPQDSDGDVDVIIPAYN
jgi:hypothetical protein